MQLASLKVIRAPAAYFLAGVFISTLSWQFGYLVFLLGLALGYRLSTSPWQVFSMFFGYYLYGSHDLLSNIPAFFSQKMEWSGAFGWIIWLVWALVLASPYLLLKKKNAVSFIAAILMVFIPPVGIFGWMSPLSAAGHLFPGTAAIGLLLTMTLMAIIAVGRTHLSVYISTFIIASSIGLNVFNSMNVSNKQQQPRQMSMGVAEGRINFISIDTSIPHNGETSPIQDMENIVSIQNSIKESIRDIQLSGITYLVLPEEVMGEWRAAKSYWMGGFVRELADKGVFVIVGADLSRDEIIYDDAALLLMPSPDNKGASLAKAYKLSSAKIPMPGGNWNFMGLGSGKSAELDVFGRGGIEYPELNDIPVYFSFCYEDFLIWPHALFYYRNNDKRYSAVWISMANNWFQSEDQLSFQVQNRSIRSTARLFGVNLLRSVNKKTLVYKK